MKVICIVFILFALTSSQTICDRYLQEIRSEESTENSGRYQVCLSDKATQSPKLSKVQVTKLRTIAALVSNNQQLKFTCFSQDEEPSKHVKNIAQCWKNTDDLSFNVSISNPLTTNQSIGEKSSFPWGDEHIQHSESSQMIDDSGSFISVFLLVISLILLVTVIVLIVKIIYSKYKKTQLFPLEDEAELRSPNRPEYIV